MAIDFKKESQNLISLRADQSKFIFKLMELSQEAEEEKSDFYQEVVTFVSGNKIDIVEYSLVAVQGGADVFRVAFLLKEVLPDLPDVNINTLYKLISIFSEKVKNDYFSGIFFDPIEKWAQKNPLQAELLQKLTISDRTLLMGGYYVSCLIGRGKSNPQAGFLEILNLAKSSELLERSLAIRCIGQWKYVEAGYEEEVIGIIRDCNKSDDPQLVTASAYATGGLLSIFPGLSDEFPGLAKSAHPEVVWEVSRQLLVIFKPKEQWWQEALSTLSNIDLKYLGIVKNIDLLLHSLLKHKELEKYEAFINLWIEHHEYKKPWTHFPELLPSSTPSLLEHPEFLSRLLTIWFAHDELIFQIYARELSDFVRLRKIKNLVFDHDIISKYDDEDILYVIRKVLGHQFDFEVCSSLVYSLLSHPNLSQKALAFIANAFIDHIGYNYPGKTIDFCKRQLNSSDNNSSQKSFLTNVLQKIERRLARLDALKAILEIRPSAEDVLKIESERQKKMSEAMKEAQEKSPLLGIVQKVNIKEGRSWFGYLHGQYSGITKLQHFQESYELPRSDVLDVVTASINRHGFRSAKRGEL